LLSVTHCETVFISFLSTIESFAFYRRRPLGSSTISHALQIIFSLYRCANVQNWNSQDCNFGHCQNSPAEIHNFSETGSAPVFRWNGKMEKLLWWPVYIELVSITKYQKKLDLLCMYLYILVGLVGWYDKRFP
jgi:hypothetical protein